ncbi:hypothetical protein BJF93_01415 [Xaviernesmea oryzae]|uniref:Uncharacterized protein n=1 Tax=Xaviernesmea oryzae TaxID=464029 RepID=A0A1Q9B295_9HYPH|nr:type II toxin-antitoxin system VapB family antitoxin [Xaviernesmea oryzae]OLP62133.1 hypothetical protein BJF93_01415 [Xaviernesmea oryzae]SEL88622.1 Rv0623-like transcription factor [Xaviernesmea oryzae]
MATELLDARSLALARKLADRRHLPLAEAVRQALENELKRVEKSPSLASRISVIAEDLASQAGPNKRVPSKDEIDALWGQS